MEKRRENYANTGGTCEDDPTAVGDPFQNRRLSQVVAQIFESSTCINQLETCESCEEEEENEGRQDDDIETDFIDYKEEPKNKELFRETFREIEAFFNRDSPIKVKVTDTDSEDNLSDLSAITDLIEKKEVELTDAIKEKNVDNTLGNKVETEVKLPKRETEINETESKFVVIGDSVVQMRRPVRTYKNDFSNFTSIGATSSMQPKARNSTVHYSNLCTKPILTNSSIETTFGVTPPEQRSSLRSIRRARSPECKRVSPTFRWSVTSV